MSLKFFCILFNEDKDKLDIRKDGMNPFVIWNMMGYKAFHENVIPVILDKLISNNLSVGYIEFIQETKKVKIQFNHSMSVDVLVMTFYRPRSTYIENIL